MNRLQTLISSLKPRTFPGCIGSCLTQIIGFLVLGSILYLLIVAVFTPWAFYLGGNFHVIPNWQGWGKLHASSGDFVLYVNLTEPQMDRRGYPYISGIAELCTPRGERFTFMHVGGLFQNKHFGLNSINQPVDLNIDNYGLFGRFKADYRPQFNLYGSWEGPNLIAEDHGGLASAFMPNGQAYLGNENDQPSAGENLLITLVPGNQQDFNTACQTAH